MTTDSLERTEEIGQAVQFRTEEGGPARLTNLPPQPTPFIGREAELGGFAKSFQKEASAMTVQGERAHGVTPGLSQDYADRTANRQAAFVLPHLRPGMGLLDVGCGPGTITLGLAQAVAPGHVTGIDHDSVHIEAARALAAERGATNVTFKMADALSLPFEDGIFDAAFENDLLTHLSQDAVLAAREVYRVLKPRAFSLHET